MNSPTGDYEETKIAWSHGATYDLIKEYKKHPVLYRTKDDNYNNKRKRFEALKTIKVEMLKRGRRISIENIKKKIHGLRTQYNFQLSKIRRSQLKARHPADVYKPTLWCFSQLEFLGDVKGPNTKPEDTETTQDSQEEWTQSNASEHSEDTQDNQDMGETVKREELTPTNSLQEVEIMPYFSDSEYGKTESGDKNDDLSIFGKLVELEMRKIRNPQALRTAKRIILNALMDAQDASDT